MTIDVLIFGPAADAAGAPRVRVTPAERPTVASVLAALADQHPALGFALSGARLAVNRAFAPAEAPIAPGDEVALISLVGGG